ncbi:MAG: sialidase [Flavobacteriaceae bacterium]|nr:sialidase [Flavobacteriaceae bacterium]
MALLMACGNKETEIQNIPFEFGINNAEPNLVAQNGKLTLSWITSIRGEEATLQYSQLEEGIWTTPKKVTSGNDWFVNWADFPANAINGDLILTSYLKKSANGKYTYDVVLNLQKLSGESIKEDFLLNTDGVNAEHGFVSMIPNAKGGFFVTWLDGRYTAGEEMEGHHKAMTIRVAEIAIDGTIYDEYELDGKVCDCCQTSINMSQQGPIVVYRDRSNEEIRDIYITRKIDSVWTKPVSVFNDGWHISGCPVNGPKVISNNENVAVAWFTAANDKPMVKLAISSNSGAQFEAPIIISETSALGRVDAVFLNSKEILVSYMENDDSGTFLKCRKVGLDGTVSEAFTISEINGSRSTGVPQLEIVGNEAYVVWTFAIEKKNQLKSVKFNTSGL